MRLLLKYHTNIGIFYIGQSLDERFHPIFNDEDLGSYAEAWQATEDLANDNIFSVLHPETGDLLDILEYEIPEDPSEWEKL